jgi:hypothetical protein
VTDQQLADAVMVQAGRVALLLWHHCPAEREQLLEQAMCDARTLSDRVDPEGTSDLCRAAVAAQLERLDAGAGHA